jgi:hypothetical protein
MFYILLFIISRTSIVTLALFLSFLQMKKLRLRKWCFFVQSHPAGQWESLVLSLVWLTLCCVLLPVFKRDQASSRPSTVTHKREEEAIAPLAGGPAEGE